LLNHYSFNFINSYVSYIRLC